MEQIDQQSLTNLVQFVQNLHDKTVSNKDYSDEIYVNHVYPLMIINKQLIDYIQYQYDLQVYNQQIVQKQKEEMVQEQTKQQNYIQQLKDIQQFCEDKILRDQNNYQEKYQKEQESNEQLIQVIDQKNQEISRLNSKIQKLIDKGIYNDGNCDSNLLITGYNNFTISSYSSSKKTSSIKQLAPNHQNMQDLISNQLQGQFEKGYQKLQEISVIEFNLSKSNLKSDVHNNNDDRNCVQNQHKTSLKQQSDYVFKDDQDSCDQIIQKVKSEKIYRHEFNNSNNHNYNSNDNDNSNNDNNYKHVSIFQCQQQMSSSCRQSSNSQKPDELFIFFKLNNKYISSPNQMDNLYGRLRQQKIQFHQWYKWIHLQLNTSSIKKDQKMMRQNCCI